MRLGGDTDTNAAIVGAVVGAFVKIDRVPAEKIQKLLECNLKQGR